MVPFSDITPQAVDLVIEDGGTESSATNALGATTVTALLFIDALASDATIEFQRPGDTTNWYTARDEAGNALINETVSAGEHRGNLHSYLAGAAKVRVKVASAVSGDKTIKVIKRMFL